MNILHMNKINVNFNLLLVSKQKKKKKKQKEEKKIQESDSFKQVKFSGDLSTVPEPSTRFRCMSRSPSPPKEQMKTISFSLRAVSQVSMFRQSLHKNQQEKTEKIVPKHRQAVTPDSMVGSRLQMKHNIEINKRVKSARQISSRQEVDALQEKHPSVGKVKSSKSELSDKCTKSQSKSSEGALYNVVDTQSTRSKVSQHKTQMPTEQNLKKTSSILKKRPMKSVNTLPAIGSDYKELRVCKSAKIKSSGSIEETEKRAHSAITYADQAAVGNVTDRQKHSRHKSSTSSIPLDKGARMCHLSTDDLKKSDIEPLDDQVEEELPCIVSSERVIDEAVKDEHATQIPVVKVTFYDDNHDNDNSKVNHGIKEKKGTKDNTMGMKETKSGGFLHAEEEGDPEESKSSELQAPLLKVTAYDDSDDEGILKNYIDEKERETDTDKSEKGTDSDGMRESEAEEDEEEDAFAFRRQGGGCLISVPENSNDMDTEEYSSDTGEADKLSGVDQPRPPRHARRMSSIMKSIMLFRKKFLAKRGIVLTSSSSSETSDSESDDSVTVELKVCYKLVTVF